MKVRKTKLVIFLIIVAIITYFAFFIFRFVKYGYGIDMQKNFKNKLCVFKPKFRKNITPFFVNCYRDWDTLFNYNINYDNKTYNITIWVFKDLLNTDKQYGFKDLSDIKFRSGEVLNSGGSPEIVVKYGDYFKKKLIVSLGNDTKIIKNIDKGLFHGVKADIYQMSLANESGNELVLWRYEKKTQAIVLTGKQNNQLYFIVIFNKKDSIDESILNVLNLD